jgi:hypothetical protein
MNTPQEFAARIAAGERDTFFITDGETVQGLQHLSEALQNVPIPEDDFYQIMRFSSPWVFRVLADRVVPGNPMITNRTLSNMLELDSLRLVTDMFVRLHPEHKNLDMPIRCVTNTDYKKIKYFLEMGFHVTFGASCTKYAIELHLEGILPIEAIIEGIRTLHLREFLFAATKTGTLKTIFETEWKEEHCKPVFSALLVKICEMHFDPANINPRATALDDINSLLKLGITKWLTHVPEGPEVLIALLITTHIPEDLLMSLVREVEIKLSVHRRKDLLYFYADSQKGTRHEVLLANMSISGFHPEELAELVPMNDYEVLRQAIIDHNSVYNELVKYVLDKDCRTILNFVLRYK